MTHALQLDANGRLRHLLDLDGLPRTTIERVLDDAARDRLAHNIIGHVSQGVKEPVLSRVFEYWRNVDADLGTTVEEGVRANLPAGPETAAAPSRGRS